LGAYPPKADEVRVWLPQLETSICEFADFLSLFSFKKSPQMNFTVYVLYSQQFNKHYVGFTSDLQSRLLSHNSLATKGFTVLYRPWTLIHTEVFETKSEAMKREKWLKSGVGRAFIKSLPH
jgi:putative endonuclease